MVPHHPEAGPYMPTRTESLAVPGFPIGIVLLFRPKFEELHQVDEPTDQNTAVDQSNDTHYILSPECQCIPDYEYGQGTQNLDQDYVDSGEDTLEPGNSEIQEN
ncbi:hypothetical protein JTB14_018315 [Gonioctena quinquepunctata]|nr:hypothetical protein JTB14_018315 [Gonioctena quinquepunctata]